MTFDPFGDFQTRGYLRNLVSEKDPDIVRRLDQEHADRTDFRAIGRTIAPWGRRIGDLRFETEGAWKRGGTTVDSLTKELRLALQYPEGAAV